MAWKDYGKLGAQGDRAELFIQKWAEDKNHQYKKGTQEDDRHRGIDCWVNNMPTDIKNSYAIYLGNYRFNTDTDEIGHFKVRHPFKLTSEATHYILTQVNNFNGGPVIYYNGPIKDYIESNFTKPNVTLTDLKFFLQKYDNKSWKDTEDKTKGPVQFLVVLKNLLFDNILRSGEIVLQFEKNDKDYSFYMVKKEHHEIIENTKKPKC
jgi:hypothetical protein